MHHRRIALSTIFFVALFLSACTGEPGDDNHHTDRDVGVDADTDPGDDADAGPDDDDADDIDDGDTDSEDGGTGDTDVDEIDPPPPWDCDPDFPLDAERYTEVEDLDDGDLLTGLYEMTRGHQSHDYGVARDFMFGDLEVRDDGMIECVYTARRVEPNGTTTPGNFNTEHTWPQSQGADEEPARSDLHHLFPSDQTANTERNNFEFGNVSCSETSCPWNDGGSSVGPSADDNRDPVFEPRQPRRGDIARASFYFAARYRMSISDQEEAVLRQWHCEDPPDDYELERNDGVEGFQGNRNPFIDRPDMVDRIQDF